ncbi:hypothetical protein FIBSPDRAFT_758943, partial [Athelia psychrophila]
MFPWLFPYGKGGVGQPAHEGALSGVSHKKWLLLYHDKRFQTDPEFALIALNHEQIKASTTSGYLLTKRKNFGAITDRLMNLNMDALASLSKRMAAGEDVKDRTPEEQDCFQLMHQVDLIAHRVQGSVSSKRYMRNEIWSLIEFQGAPSWFITFSPADIKHPICLYYAGEQMEFKPMFAADDARLRMVANNPVAGARFFHFMVQCFIETVLGVAIDGPGLFGDTAAYYGTVEQ